MSTNFSMSDSLPKSAGGQAFAALTDVATSQLDFALMAGIGSRTTGSKIVAALQVATYVGASRIDTPVLGVALMGHYTSAVCAMGLGQAMPIRADASGMLYAGAPSHTALFNATSQNIFKATSGIVYSGVIACSGGLAGACVVLMDGTTSRSVFVFSAANETVPFSYGDGGVWFGTNIRHEFRNSLGTPYVSLVIDA